MRTALYTAETPKELMAGRTRMPTICFRRSGESFAERSAMLGMVSRPHVGWLGQLGSLVERRTRAICRDVARALGFSARRLRTISDYDPIYHECALPRDTSPMLLQLSKSLYVRIDRDCQLGCGRLICRQIERRLQPNWRHGVNSSGWGELIRAIRPTHRLPVRRMDCQLQLSHYPLYGGLERRMFVTAPWEAYWVNRDLFWRQIGTIFLESEEISKCRFPAIDFATGWGSG